MENASIKADRKFFIASHAPHSVIGEALVLGYRPPDYYTRRETGLKHTPKWASYLLP
jgi:hypothetical protein